MYENLKNKLTIHQKQMKKKWKTISKLPFKNLLSILDIHQYVCIYIWIFYSVFYFIYLLLCQCHAVFIIMSLWDPLGPGDVMPMFVFFMFRVVLILMCFDINFIMTTSLVQPISQWMEGLSVSKLLTSGFILRVLRRFTLLWKELPGRDLSRKATAC